MTMSGDLLTSGPLRGRGAELAVVLRALRGSRAGGSALVVITGEPGIGKSAVLAAGVEQAGRLGYSVGTAAAHDGDNIAPLASLGPALRSGTDPLIGSADFLRLAQVIEQPLWLAEHVATLLEERVTAGPVMVVLDDFHWADPLSAFVLRIIPSRLAGAPVVWLLASRAVPGELVAAASSAIPVHRIELGPLTPDAVLAIADDRLGRPADAGLVEALHDTGGNPFLAVQLLEGFLAPALAAGGSGGTPSGLSDGVRMRLSLVSDRCGEMVRTGAVLGARFPLDDVAWMLGVPPATLTEPLSEAIRAGLLADDGVLVAFRHELLRQAIYEDVPPSARRVMHRSIAEHFLASGRSQAEAAPHYLAIAEAGDPVAIRVLRRAAHELLDSMAVTSITLIRQACALLPQRDPERGVVGREVVSVLVQAHRHEEAREFADQLLAADIDAFAAAETRLLLMPRMLAVGKLAELTTLARDGYSDAASPLQARLASYASFDDGPAGQARIIAESSGDQAASAVALAAAALEAEREGRFGAARQGYARASLAALAAADAVGVPSAAYLGIREALARAHLDDIEGARRQLAGEQDTGGIVADSWLEPELGWARAYLELGAGRLDDAVAFGRRALRAMDELHDHSFVAQVRSVLASVALLRGNRAEALAQLTNAERGGTSMPLLRAMLACADGDLAKVPAVLMQINAGVAPWHDELLVDAACVAASVGNVAALSVSTAALAELADRNPNVASAAGAAALARGLETGDLTPALTLLHASPRPLLLARAEAEYGRVALTVGDRAAGIAALHRAEEVFSSFGAAVAAARVQRTLSTAGVRRHRRVSGHGRPESGWAALTAAERQVAQLVADGHTNKSAAAELTLSPSTINSHLRAVFLKLGVNTRVQLANVVRTAVDQEP